MSSRRSPKPANGEVESEASRGDRRERPRFVFRRAKRETTRRRKALLLSAEAGEIVAVVPQFTLFEIAYVLDGFYKVPLPTIADAIRATLTYPGVIATDDCSWLRVLDHWPEPLASITDAAIVAVALANKYDSVATFDHKLIRRMKALGVDSYF